MKLTKELEYFLLALILGLGIILRVFLINVIPPALNEDEAALGYNTYSLLQTARDEHGVFLPLSLESFGDWKLPLYSYVDILPVAALGLNEFTTRLPSIVSGVVGIVLIFYISNLFFKKKEISLLASFFFALSPWNIYFSRAAYEVNLATTIFLGGLLAFLYGANKKRGKNILLVSSGILFGLTLFSYHSYIIFTPLFVTAISFLNFKEIRGKLIFLIIPFLFFCLISFYSSFTTSSSKLNTTTVFNNKNIIYNRVENFKKDSTIPLNKIFTKYTGVPYQILQNYALSFSPTFLFDRGGEKLIHNLDGFGNLYLFDALLLVSGLAGIFYFRERSIKLMGSWLVLAPIPSVLTIDTPNSTRLFILMPLFAIISAYGAYSIILLLKKKTVGKIIIEILIFLFFLNLLYFINLYFINFPYHRARFWHYGFKQAVEASNKYKDYNVIMRAPEDFPYIYFLFYNKYDPKKFMSEATYYSATYDGFRYVKSFGRYVFTTDIDYRNPKKNTVYIDNRGFTQKTHNILLPNGDPILMWQINDEISK